MQGRSLGQVGVMRSSCSDVPQVLDMCQCSRCLFLNTLGPARSQVLGPGGHLSPAPRTRPIPHTSLLQTVFTWTGGWIPLNAACKGSKMLRSNKLPAFAVNKRHVGSSWHTYSMTNTVAQHATGTKVV